MKKSFFWVTLAFAMGIIVNANIAWPLKYWSFTAMILFSLCLVTANRQRLSNGLVLLAFCALGAVHAQNVRTYPQNHISHEARYHRLKPVELEGLVISEVRVKDFFKGDKSTFTLKVQRIKTPWGWRFSSGKLQVNLFRKEDIHYGDMIRLKGKMSRPYDFSRDTAFSYPDYLRNRGITHIVSVKKQGELIRVASGKASLFMTVLLRFRLRVKKILEDNLTRNEAGIMQAVLIGERSGIPRIVNDLFVRTGTAHVLAISGLHVGIVAGLMFLIFKLLPLQRPFHYWLTLFVLLGYAILTGGRPSVVRASIMSGIFLFSFLVEREADGINSLFLSALIILLINPLSLFDVGFQLSYVSVLSIIVFYPFFNTLFGRLTVQRDNKVIDYLFKSLSVSLSAWLGVSGLIAYYFKIITPITILANLFVIPLLTVIVTLGLGMVCSGVIFPFAAEPFAACLKIVLNLLVTGIFILDKFPLAHFSLTSVTLWHVVFYYLFVLVLAGAVKGISKIDNPRQL